MKSGFGVLGRGRTLAWRIGVMTFAEIGLSGCLLVELTASRSPHRWEFHGWVFGFALLSGWILGMVAMKLAPSSPSVGKAPIVDSEDLAADMAALANRADVENEEHKRAA